MIPCERHGRPTFDCSLTETGGKLIDSSITINPGGIEVGPSVDSKSTSVDEAINEMELKEVKREESSPQRMPVTSKRTQTKDESRVVAV